MRDPERLTKFYREMRNLHRDNLPDLRIGQLILNFIGWYESKYHSDFFYLEDAQFVEKFKEYIHVCNNVPF